MRIDGGSFRDPFGYVFREGPNVFRHVLRPGAVDYEAGRDSGVFGELIGAGLLIPHEELVDHACENKDVMYALAHPTIPIVSYPWEWCFSMLKDAALLHLEIMQRLVPRGFWLRDANAFNVQYDGQRILLIDTLSVGRRKADSPWVAYGQFCGQFLAPLAVAAYSDVRMLNLWRNFINGFPLDLSYSILPLGRRVSPRLLMHLGLHAKAQKIADRKENLGRGVMNKKPRVTDRGLMGLIGSLRHTVEGIKWKRASRIWEAYGDIRTYGEEDVALKADYVDKIVNRLKPETVWDLGANTGEFSIVAAAHSGLVVSIDGDAACTENLYLRIADGKAPRNILPITMDLANPSPGLGWENTERLSLSERGPADLILALALVHHLVLSSNIPFARVVQWLAAIGKNLLVEFIPYDDPMVEKLRRNRDGEHLPYGEDVFLRNIESAFDIQDRCELANGRVLFFCSKSLSDLS